MLADGYSTRRGRRAAYLHYDAINRRVRPRKSARIIALTNGGAIPDQFDCDVILQPEGFRIGTIGEDFAFESLPVISSSWAIAPTVLSNPRLEKYLSKMQKVSHQTYLSGSVMHLDAVMNYLKRFLICAQK